MLGSSPCDGQAAVCRYHPPWLYPDRCRGHQHHVPVLHLLPPVRHCFPRSSWCSCSIYFHLHLTSCMMDYHPWGTPWIPMIHQNLLLLRPPLIQFLDWAVDKMLLHFGDIMRHILPKTCCPGGSAMSMASNSTNISMSAWYWELQVHSGVREATVYHNLPWYTYVIICVYMYIGIQPLEQLRGLFFHRFGHWLSEDGIQHLDDMMVMCMYGDDKAHRHLKIQSPS